MVINAYGSRLIRRIRQLLNLETADSYLGENLLEGMEDISPNSGEYTVSKFDTMKLKTYRKKDKIVKRFHLSSRNKQISQDTKEIAKLNRSYPIFALGTIIIIIGLLLFFIFKRKKQVTDVRNYTKKSISMLHI